MELEDWRVGELELGMNWRIGVGNGELEMENWE
jgi:hypothetical protein